ncbi:DUF3179 domain-containing (seleno)protein [Haloferax sp. Q22]|uniref:DUF3179 domain-containing (seleno)protein n=1 Tax=Haloferax sp. (strain Q22) TaxID=1526048 RepID=UPI0012FADC98|nr:DUF3179 domain-containing (seleno)protein [Haloferax sp. Q22]
MLFLAVVQTRNQLMEIIHGFDSEFIPSITTPRFVTDYAGDPNDEVLVVETDESARAYPIPILDLHHMVNDTVDGTPVLVAWCPLCGSGVVYERTIEKQELTFEFAGKLADNNFVMRDIETGTEWKQSTGEGLSGDLEGVTLPLQSARMTTWNSFQDAYPAGVVLAPPEEPTPYLFYRFEKTATRLISNPAGREFLDGVSKFVRAANLARDPQHGSSDVSIRPFFRLMQAGVELSDWVLGRSERSVQYDGEPMALYESGRVFGFPPVHGGTREWDNQGLDGLRAKTRVLGVSTDGAALGFPRPHVEAADGVVRATVGETDVVVFATDDELVAYDAPGFSFEATDDPDRFVGDGAKWDVATGESTDGRTLSRLPARWTFAFSWQSDHETARLYGC